MTLPDAAFSFGRHRGLPVSAVARSAPGYLLWVATIRPTRADARLWASVKAHLLQAAAMLEQRDLIEREELEARRARRQALVDEAARRAAANANRPESFSVNRERPGSVQGRPRSATRSAATDTFNDADKDSL